MTPCALTAGITALANAIAARLCDEDLNLLALVLTQLGDTLATLAAHRACVCEKNAGSPSVTEGGSRLT